MNDIKTRENNDLLQKISLAKEVITQEFLYKLGDYEVVELPEELKKLDINRFVRVFRFVKMISDEKESVIDKFITVLNAAYSCNATVITLIVGKKDITEYYLGVVSKDLDQENQTIETQAAVLESVLRGNFPGLDIREIKGEERRKLLSNSFSYDYVSSISGIASIRNEDNGTYENYVQGIEHLVDSLEGREYSILVLADPISPSEISLSKQGFEMLASQLSPFAKMSVSDSESKSITLTTTQTNGITETIGESTSFAQNYSNTTGWSSSTSKSETRNLGTGVGSAVGVVVGTGVGIAAAVATEGAGAAAIPVFAGAGAGICSALGGAIGGLFGSDTESKSQSKNGSITEGNTTTSGENKSKATQRSTSDSEAEALTSGTTVQVNYDNKTIQSLLEKIDGNLKRIQKCEAYGAFRCATYVISSDYESNTIVSSAYNALMRGDNSSLQASQINTWDSEDYRGKMVKEYIKRFSHPIFSNPYSETVTYTPAVLANSYEVAVSLGLPKKSINGLSVSEMASFGRNVFKVKGSDNIGKSIELGRIYHMGKEETGNVELSIESLAMHTFITGSTGSGKSNTIYQLLRELNHKEVKYLVVEPAKGEYKNVFGTEARVYGTNPKVTSLIRINPFRFPEGIHVLEHIDRLIELFNVCWPMYAAMPAVLKDAVEKAYISSGWDLTNSSNLASNELFPTFEDVLFKLNDVIEKSSFSQEVKDNYIGSLSTRIKSLTNGIFGHIFTNDELGDQTLFDENIIVDLSRVGSVETKAMIMGILVMRLQEYRMTIGEMNSNLKHVTVLEEAHNLLKRTSTEQSSESANLLGKSVEMISNAIAEVRTYGEGFIIADQAPGLLDKSVIRNTNTKIIMRLPDAEDRELVGRSANLTEEQIKELAKLPTGIGAVYQNDWQEPVLCKVIFKKVEGKYSYQSDLKEREDIRLDIVNSLLSKMAGEKIDKVDDFSDRILKAMIPGRVKYEAVKCLKAEKTSIDDIKSVIHDLCLNPHTLIRASAEEHIEDWRNIILSESTLPLMEMETEKQNIIIECILREQIEAYNKPRKYIDTWYQYLKGEVI